VLKLTRFNHNPSPSHFEKVYQIINYFLKTQNLTIKLEYGNNYETFSDTSFANNTLNRKSSQVYTIKLIGSIVIWRTNKQDTVTTTVTTTKSLSQKTSTSEKMILNYLKLELLNTAAQYYILNFQNLNIICKNFLHL